MMPLPPREEIPRNSEGDGEGTRSDGAGKRNVSLKTGAPWWTAVPAPGSSLQGRAWEQLVSLSKGPTAGQPGRLVSYPVTGT